MKRKQYILFRLRREAALLIIHVPPKLQPQHVEMAACPWAFTWKNMALSREHEWFILKRKRREKKAFSKMCHDISEFLKKKEKVKLLWLKMCASAASVQTGKVSQTALKLICKLRSPLVPPCFSHPSLLAAAQGTQGQVVIPRRHTRSAWCSGQMLQQPFLCSTHLLLLAGSSGP